MKSQPTEMTFGELMALIWAARRFVLSGMICAALAGFAFLALTRPHYEAVMVIAPAQPMEVSAQNVEALSYTGQTLDQKQKTAALNFERFQSVAEGASVAELLLRSAEITDGLKQDKSFRFSATDDRWSAEKLASYIDDRVSFTAKGDTALRLMRYRHTDPEFAVTFLKRVHALADGVIRQGERKAVNERISYLQAEITKTYNPEHRRALTDLLMEQERLKMMVSLDQPYAAAIVENAYSSYQPRWPDRMLVLTGAMIMGAVSGLLIFLNRLASPVAIGAGQDNQTFSQANPSIRKSRRWDDLVGGNNNAPLTAKKKNIPPEAAE